MNMIVFDKNNKLLIANHIFRLLILEPRYPVVVVVKVN